MKKGYLALLSREHVWNVYVVLLLLKSTDIALSNIQDHYPALRNISVGKKLVV